MASRSLKWGSGVESDFSKGAVRDSARIGIPLGGVYDSLDFLLHRPGVAFKRGGTSYHGSAASSAFGTVTYLNAVVQAFFPNLAASKIMAISDLGDFIDVSSAISTIGMGVVTRDKPKIFTAGTTSYMVVTDASGVSIPYVWTGTGVSRPLGGTTQTLTVTGTPTGGSVSVSMFESLLGVSVIDATSIVFNSSNSTAKTALDGNPNITGTFTVTGGALPGTPLVITRGLPNNDLLWLGSGYNALTGGSSPAATLAWNTTATNCPTAKYSTVHLSRLVLADGGRIYFSPITPGSANDPTQPWDTAAYVDANAPVTGMAVVNGALLVFSLGQLEKFVGNTPPPGSDFVHSTVDTVGCTDARSLTVNQGVCIFANPNGVYQTNGLTPESLTEGRIGTYWRSLFSGYSPSTWIISTGVYGRRFLFVTILDNSRALVASLMCDLSTRSWVRVSGQNATMYGSSSFSSVDELYASSASLPRVTKLSGMFTPASGNKNDADGTAVTGTLETRALGGLAGVKAWGDAQLTYDMRDAATDNPTLAITRAPGLNATTYTAVPESPLAETSEITRKGFSLNADSQAMSVKFVQTNASSKTEIYGFEYEVRGYAPDADGT